MKGVELYAKVRYAVRIEGIGERRRVGVAGPGHRRGDGDVVATDDHATAWLGGVDPHRAAGAHRCDAGHHGIDCPGQRRRRASDRRGRGDVVAADAEFGARGRDRGDEGRASVVI